MSALGRKADVASFDFSEKISERGLLFFGGLTSTLITIFEKGEIAPPTPSGWGPISIGFG